MRWWLGLAGMSVFAVACEHDFSVRSRWTAGNGGAAGSAGDSLGGTEPGNGGEPPMSGSGGRAGNGGRSSGGRDGDSAGKSPTSNGGDGSDDSGGAGAVGASPAGGSGADAGQGGDGGAGAGAYNLPPHAVFDHYHRYRGEDTLENQGDAGNGGASGTGGVGNAPPAYAVPPGPASLLGNDVDPEGVELSLQGGTATSERGGSVVIASDGSFVYTPPSARFWGDDYFDYVLTDGEHSTPGRARFTLSERKVRFEEVEAGDSNGWLLLGADDDLAFGRVAAPAGDVNGDGIDDLLVGAPGSYLPSPGALYVVFGRADTNPLRMEDIAAGSGAGFLIEGFRLAWEHGFPLGGAGDLNGDGLGDLVIASLATETAAAPSVFVVLGRRETTPLDLADVTPSGGPLGVRIDPLNVSDRFGTSVAGIGDFNGDGYDEVAIGAPGSTRGANVEVGAVHVLLGRSEFGQRGVNLEDVIAGTGDEPGFTLRGIRADSRAGFSVGRAGDVNGDGLSDLVIGAPEQDPGVSFNYSTGSAYVVFGAPDPDTIDLGWLEEGRAEGFFIRGIANNITALGYSVAGAGFFDQDGLADVVTGMPDYYTTDAQFHGGAYVATGRSEPRSVTVNPDLVPVDGYIVRAYWGATAQGRSVASGDFDGDGWSDITMAGNDQSHQTYVAFGGDGQVGTHHVSLRFTCADDPNEPGLFPPQAGVNVLCFGDELPDFGPRAPTLAGDFNGDGIDDVYVGSAAWFYPAGGAHVIFGWDVRNKLGARRLVELRGAGDDTIEYSGGEILRFSGGAGTDTLALTGPGTAFDLRSLEPTRLVSIERIDLSGSGNYVVTIDDAHVRILPSAVRDDASGLAKTLTVRGDAGDQLLVADLDDFEELERAGSRRVFRRRGRYYGFALEGDVSLARAASP